MTRLGDLLQFGQLFKACGNNYFAKIANILGNLCKVVKIFFFLAKIIFGQLLQTFGNFLRVTLVTINIYLDLGQASWLKSLLSTLLEAWPFPILQMSIRAIKTST